MGELYYLFASSAALYRDGQTCLKGMRLLADTLHPLGVKITWLVSADSARVAADELTRWHECHGDDVALHLPKGVEGPDPRVAIERERDAVHKALPWAQCTVAGWGHAKPGVAQLVADLGFEGLWGFSWEQIEVDNVTDRGCPWGFYYMDRDDRLRPAQGRGVIGMEWTARDLLKGFQSGNPCLYSTDPNDVARGGICSWDQIDYWNGLADNYIRNKRYNREIFLLQHQEAHEMECTPAFQCYTEEDAQEAAIMLRGFAERVMPHARSLTLSEAARLYREHYETTAPSYMLWEDTPTPRRNRDYMWNTPEGPWPKTFLYYDREAQMMFIEGKADPICLRNYAKPWDTRDFYMERHMPIPRLVHNIQYSWSREIEVTVKSDRDMPYGLVFWEDFSLYRPGESVGVSDVKILAPELLFARVALKTGDNRFTIRLKGK